MRKIVGILKEEDNAVFLQKKNIGVKTVDRMKIEGRGEWSIPSKKYAG